MTTMQELWSSGRWVDLALAIVLAEVLLMAWLVQHSKNIDTGFVQPDTRECAYCEDRSAHRAAKRCGLSYLQIRGIASNYGPMCLQLWNYFEAATQKLENLSPMPQSRKDLKP